MNRTSPREARRGVTRLTHSPGRGTAQAELTLRVDFGEQGALGPGKVRLMELIAEKGSISAAGRAMGMSYRRAWLLVESLNQAFKEPLVTAKHGGKAGGGAELTALGARVVRCYRDMERAAHEAASGHLKTLGRIVVR